jgi:transcriptional regulator with XRE-family HTH domain
MTTIGQRLKEQRDGLALSQEAFGQIAGVGKRAQINYEQGLRVPDADYLAAIAAAGCDVLYVITGRKESATPTQEQLTQFSDQHRLQLAIEAVEEGLAEIKRKLPPAKKAELIVAAYELMAQPEQAKNNVIRLVRVAA